LQKSRSHEKQVFSNQLKSISLLKKLKKARDADKNAIPLLNFFVIHIPSVIFAVAFIPSVTPSKKSSKCFQVLPELIFSSLVISSNLLTKSAYSSLKSNSVAVSVSSSTTSALIKFKSSID
jgi:hypothetical protein